MILYEKRLEMNQALARSLGLKLHEIVQRSPLPGGRTSYTYLITKGEEERALAGARSLAQVELYLDGLQMGMRLAKGDGLPTHATKESEMFVRIKRVEGGTVAVVRNGAAYRLIERTGSEKQRLLDTWAYEGPEDERAARALALGGLASIERVGQTL